MSIKVIPNKESLDTNVDMQSLLARLDKLEKDNALLRDINKRDISKIEKTHNPDQTFVKINLYEWQVVERWDNLKSNIVEKRTLWDWTIKQVEEQISVIYIDGKPTEIPYIEAVRRITSTDPILSEEIRIKNGRKHYTVSYGDKTFEIEERFINSY